MKLLLCLLGLAFCSQTFAQTQDLITLAKGDYLGMNALFNEKGDLFGYISIYDYGKSGAKTKKFEYVILDKNLNPFANNTFEGDITAGDYYGYMNFDRKIILRPSKYDYSLVEKKEMFNPSSMLIDLKDNSIKRKAFYDFDHGKFNEILQHDLWSVHRKENRVERRQKGFNYLSYVAELKDGGYLVSHYDNYGDYEQNNALMRYDEDQKQVWQYAYNTKGTRTEWQDLSFLGQDENHYYGLMRERIKSREKFYLLVLDMKTGKELHKKEIIDQDNVLRTIKEFPSFNYGRLDNDKSFDDKIVVVGRVGYSGIFYTGVCRLMIDKTTFTPDLKILYYKDLKNYIPKIKANGNVENSYMLDPRDIFFLKDGSVGFLFEKSKPATQYNPPKATDLVYLHVDKDFNIVNSKIFEKEKSIWETSDYLFSQNLNNDKDLVFFYRDYQKEEDSKNRNWNLFINTFIDGKINQEKIPISSKENFLIIPYVAKEGYIMLQELNVKAKYNKIRLERLNY